MAGTINTIPTSLHQILPGQPALCWTHSLSRGFPLHDLIQSPSHAPRLLLANSQQHQSVTLQPFSHKNAGLSAPERLVHPVNSANAYHMRPSVRAHPHPTPTPTPADSPSPALGSFPWKALLPDLPTARREAAGAAILLAKHDLGLFSKAMSTPLNWRRGCARWCLLLLGMKNPFALVSRLQLQQLGT